MLRRLIKKNDLKLSSEIYSKRNNYIQSWSNKLDSDFIPYTASEFKFYMNLCLENQYIYDIQIDHYIDNGCFCKHCINKRKDIFFRAKAGEKHFEKIIHTEVINEVKTEKLKEINTKIKRFTNKEISNKKFKPKQFKINITNN
jgi:hypothetical protein